MLISSMEQLNYYQLPKENYLEIDTSHGFMIQEETSPTYLHLNEENSPKNGTKSSLYKTELCKRFSEFGSCRYGTKCQFAHGLAELRHVLRHPKYKTTKCKSYWGSGHCPYGSRCRFIHEETEGGGNIPYSPHGHSMFFHDDTAHMEMYSAANNMNHEYGEYSLLNSTPWGSNSSPSLHQYPSQQPDLQNAIDALMKFSISSEQTERSPRNTTTSHRIGTLAKTREGGSNELWRDFPLTPHDHSEPEQTLHNNSPVDFGDKEWPASLTLSLEGTGLFQENDETDNGEQGHKDEKSPRLSIFERFH